MKKDTDARLRKKLKELGAELERTGPGTPEYDRILREVDSLVGIDDDEEPQMELDDLW